MNDFVLKERWEWHSGSFYDAPEELRQRRTDWLLDFFGSWDSYPPYLWRVDFGTKEGGAKVLVAHTYATHPDKGGRYITYVKGYSVNGDPETLRLPAANAPEEFPVEEFPNFKEYSEFQYVR